ncbi:MAG: hypothetical protein ACYC8T_19010 [Myxococcaceae bacterium]
MNRILVLLLLCAFPSIALAAPGARLLEQRLTLHLGALEAAGPQSELSPPPPPPPLVPLEDAVEPPADPAADPAAEPTASLDLSPGEGPPGIGPVLGFMITGWVALGVGAVFGLYSLIFFSEAATFNTRTSAAMTEAAVTMLVFALIHVGIGLPLAIIGHKKKAARNRYFEERSSAWLQPGTNGRLAVFTF